MNPNQAVASSYSSPNVKLVDEVSLINVSLNFVDVISYTMCVFVPPDDGSLNDMFRPWGGGGGGYYFGLGRVLL
jgi:hypothetical protein